MPLKATLTLKQMYESTIMDIITIDYTVHVCTRSKGSTNLTNFTDDPEKIGK